MARKEVTELKKLCVKTVNRELRNSVIHGFTQYFDTYLRTEFRTPARFSVQPTSSLSFPADNFAYNGSTAHKCVKTPDSGKSLRVHPSLDTPERAIASMAPPVKANAPERFEFK
jgi:hypothetical protein